jgi:hypothetical protein
VPGRCGCPASPCAEAGQTGFDCGARPRSVTGGEQIEHGAAKHRDTAVRCAMPAVLRLVATRSIYLAAGLVGQTYALDLTAPPRNSDDVRR